ncbi:MAG: NAD-dependent epimerase/dehydratase family protein [Asgard group archaeon]|nr:NAD-dependent epimerase/dehydratase family protein [Asgard group archaeon]
MSILITGLTGFLGSHLVRELRSKYPNKDLSALILPHEREMCKEYEKYEINFIFGDVSSKASLKGCFDGIESVFHLAAIVDDLAPLSNFYKINHLGTKNLLEEFVDAGSNTFIYMSTLGIFGFNLPDYPIDEDYEVDLIPGYRESKYLGEKEVFKFAEEFGFKASVLRPPGIFGPGDPHWIPNIFKLVESGKKIPLINGDNVVYAYSYVFDIIESLMKMEELDEAKGEAFNHTSFQVTNKELFETAAKISNTEFDSYNLNYKIAMIVGLIGELQWKLVKKRPLLNRYRVKQMGKSRLVNTEKIEKKLGVSTQISFEEVLRESYKCYKKEN